MVGVVITPWPDSELATVADAADWTAILTQFPPGLGWVALKLAAMVSTARAICGAVATFSTTGGQPPAAGLPDEHALAIVAIPIARTPATAPEPRTPRRTRVSPLSLRTDIQIPSDHIRQLESPSGRLVAMPAVKNHGADSRIQACNPRSASIWGELYSGTIMRHWRLPKIATPVRAASRVPGKVILHCRESTAIIRSVRITAEPFPPPATS